MPRERRRQLGKTAGLDQRAMRPCLAADRQPQWIGVKRHEIRGREARHGSADAGAPQKRSSRQRCHGRAPGRAILSRVRRGQLPSSREDANAHSIAGRFSEPSAPPPALTIVPRRVLGGTGLRRAERHDSARPGRLRHASPATGQHGPGRPARSPVRRRRRSQPRLAGLRRLGRMGEPRSDSQIPRRARLGRRRHRHPRGPRRRAADHGDVLPQAESPGVRHPLVRRLPGDAREGDGHPGRREHHARSPARQHQHLGAPERTRRHLAQARRERAPRSAAHAAGRARKCRAVAPAGLQQQSRPVHAGRVDQGRRDWNGARSAQLDRSPLLATGHAVVPRVGPARSVRLQLAALAGARTRSSVPSELHVRRVPRLVSVRHRLPRRHGPLQPVAAVSHPRSRRACLRRGTAEQRSRASMRTM